jgi:hypothetical protein
MEVNFLRHRITQEGLKMDDHKVKAILDWEPFKSVSALKTFLELCEDSHTLDKPLEEVRRNLQMGWNM